MVFLSTLAALLGRPIAKSIFSVGERGITRQILLDEVATGLVLVLPICLVIAQFTMRLAAAGWRPAFFRERSEIWTTLWITVVGDLMLEVLLNSLHCLPMDEGADARENEVDMGVFPWLARSWGFLCPADDDFRYVTLFSPDAMGCLLSLRLLFVCLGVYLGEAFVPIALTGSIATGKTTVATLLESQLSGKQQAQKNLTKHAKQQSSQANTSVGGNYTKKKKNKAQPQDAAMSSSQQQPQGNAATTSPATTATSSDQEDEGTCYMINADAIAHDILLPPQVLQGSSTVKPSESVYNEIIDTFGDDIVDKDDPNRRIQRRKLGSLIFTDRSMRRALNNITHPRIISILVKRLLYGIFWSNYDLVCADIPLLFESGQLRRLFCLTIVVACDADKQLQRLRKRDPDLTEEQCRERIASQFPLEEKIRHADIVIWNNDDPESLAKQVEHVRRDIMGRLYGVGMSLLQMLLLVGGSLSLAVSSKFFSLE